MSLILSQLLSNLATIMLDYVNTYGAAVVQSIIDGETPNDSPFVSERDKLEILAVNAAMIAINDLLSQFIVPITPV